MSGFFDDVPIVEALDAYGVMRNVDDVPRGLECACFCPSCHAPMVAVQGNKRIHHFRHDKGQSCTWASDAALVYLVVDIIRNERTITVPRLFYFDVVADKKIEVSGQTKENRRLSQINSTLMDVPHREVPVCAVSIQLAKSTRTFALIPWLSHEPDKKTLWYLSKNNIDVIGIDLKSLVKALKNREGRHADRLEILAKAQSRKTLTYILKAPDHRYKTWLSNAKADRLKKESAQRADEIAERKREAERKRLEVQRQKEEKRRAALHKKRKKRQVVVQQEEEARLKRESEKRKNEEDDRRRQEEADRIARETQEAQEKERQEKLVAVEEEKIRQSGFVPRRIIKKSAAVSVVQDCPLFGEANTITQCGGRLGNPACSNLADNRWHFHIACKR